jgi:hypothetical protein
MYDIGLAQREKDKSIPRVIASRSFDSSITITLAMNYILYEE